MDVKEKRKPGPKAGRPDEIKLPVGLRMFPSDRSKIEKAWGGSLQRFFDHVVGQEIERVPQGPSSDPETLRTTDY